MCERCPTACSAWHITDGAGGRKQTTRLDQYKELRWKLEPRRSFSLDEHHQEF